MILGAGRGSSIRLFIYSSIRSVFQNAVGRVLVCIVTHVSCGVVLFDGVGGEGMEKPVVVDFSTFLGDTPNDYGGYTGGVKGIVVD